METKHAKYERLLERCKRLAPTPTAVAHPCDETSLRGAIEAADLGLLTPILVGPRAKIQSVAKQSGVDISRYELVDSPHSRRRRCRPPCP
jgi:phosphate acetyltransferase